MKIPRYSILSNLVRHLSLGAALTVLPVMGLFSLSLYTYTRPSTDTRVSAATSDTLNFQARILTSSGNIVPDGSYHIEFKLYDGGTAGGPAGTGDTNAGSLLWTETRTTGNLVRVVNGYVSVNLGSVTAFPSTIQWDNQLYLTMNIGGTAGTASFDGEMLAPGNKRTKLTAVPYAFSAGQLARTDGANRGVLQFGTVMNNPVITLPDATGTICLQGSANCGFAAGNGDADYIQNSTALQTSANFNIQSGAALSVGGIIRGATSQTADLLQLQDSSGNTLSRFNNQGYLLLGSSTIGAYIQQSAQVGFRDALRISRGGTGVGGIGADATGTKLQIYSGGATLDDTTARVTIDSTGNVGIGTASPTSRLTVAGPDFNGSRIISQRNSADEFGPSFYLRKSRGTEAAPTNVQQGDTLGLVYGSGYKDGAYRQAGYLGWTAIDVAIANKLGSNFSISVNDTTSGDPIVPFLINGSGDVLIGDVLNISAQLGVRSTKDREALIVQGFSTQTTDLLQVKNNTGTELFTIDATGNTGIGAGTPAYKLDVNGATRFQAQASAPTAAKGVIYFDNTASKFKCSENGSTFVDCIASGGAGGTLQTAYDSGNTINTTDNRNILFNLADTATDANFLVNILGTTNQFAIQDNGTTFAAFKDGGDLVLGNTTVASDQYARLQINDEDGLNSEFSFRVASNSYGAINFSSSGGTLATPTASVTTDILGDIKFNAYNGTSFLEAASIYSELKGTGNNGTLFFRTAGVDRLYIENDGNIGIGTTDPSYKLEVNGAFRLQPSVQPTAAQGVIFFDSSTNKFRCSENGTTFIDCISGGASTTLQAAYNASIGGTTPEIKLGTTRTGLDIQDADTTLGATTPLLTVRGSNASALGSSLFTVLANGNVGINVSNPGTLIPGSILLEANKAQNGATAIATFNTDNTGNATSGFVAYNESNTNSFGYFGIGGTGYASIPILQDRAFISTGTNTAGIAINNAGAQPIVFGVSNNEVARFNSSGQFGIGNSPSTRLDVGANTTSNEIITVRSGRDAGINLLADTDNDGLELGAPYIQLSQDNFGTRFMLGMTQADNVDATGAVYTGALVNSTILGGYNASGAVQIGTNGMTRLTVAGSGNVGIGTNAPQLGLTMGAGKIFGIELPPTSGVTATPSPGGTLLPGTYYFKVVAMSGTNGLSIFSNEAVCSIVLLSGNNRCVVSWTAVPGANNYRVYKGAASNAQDQYFAVGGGGAVTTYSYDADTGSIAGTGPTATTAYTVALNPTGTSWIQGGNFGIGTSTPASKLQVAGDIRLGLVSDIITGAGPGDSLFFSGGGSVDGTRNSDNSDTIKLSRYNVATDSTELRLELGDDGGTGDFFAIQTTTGANVGDGGNQDSPGIALRSQYDSDPTTGIVATFRQVSLRTKVLATGAYRLAVSNDTGTEFVTFDGTNQRLGVGNTAPTYKLDVSGAFRLGASAAPAVARGVMYFDSSANKFKCSETGTSFVDCIGAGGGSSATLQSAYDASTNPELTLDSTRGAITVRDNATPITGNLFEIQNNAGTNTYFNVSTSSVNIAVTGANALRIQNAGGASTLFVADTSANIVKVGAVTSTLSGAVLAATMADITTTLRIGDGTNGVSFNDQASSKLRLRGTARNDISLWLRPEFEGNVFYGDGTNNIGSLTADFCSGSGKRNIVTGICTVSTEEHTFYSWTTTQASAQDYDMYMRWYVPDDYDGSLTLDVNGWRSNGTDEAVEFSVFDPDDAAAGCVNGTNVATGTGAWTFTSLNLAGCNGISAGQFITFKVRMVAGQNDFARLGEIRVTYKSNF